MSDASRKWISLCLVVLGYLFPGVYLFYTTSLAPFIIVGGYIGLLMVSLSLILGMDQLHGMRQSYRALNLNHAKEKDLNEIIKKLCKKAGIVTLLVKVQLADMLFPNLAVSVKGFPFKNQLFMSEELIEVYQNGLSKASLKALLAHEIGHLQHGDTLSNLLLVSFILSLRLALFFGFVMLLWFEALLVPLFLLSVINLFNVWHYSIFQRASEFQADMAALKMVKKPHAVKRFLFDRYLQYLHWGKLVLESKRAGKQSFLICDDRLVEKLKALHQNLTELNYLTLYQQLSQWRDENTHQPRGLAQFHSYCQNAADRRICLNSHPTLAERLDALEHQLKSI